jgi:hypothetical protein
VLPHPLSVSEGRNGVIGTKEVGEECIAVKEAEVEELASDITNRGRVRGARLLSVVCSIDRSTSSEFFFFFFCRL